MPVQAGKIVEGKVTGITNFGAFVELPDGEVGLVHISEIAEEYVKDINDFLKVNDLVKVKVISVDPKGKIGLSIKQTVEKRRPAPRKKFEISFEEKLSRFLKDSEERQQGLRRNADAKRGGRGNRRS
ncbi:S1 RNA-binding domain-containing protein [Desulfallas thermosapovorans]|uniref:S1 RNA binding domain protein n=1 Tax=Desulfallas thermosapovorans DSM 6562 TaxID=1121431 RepID=A0A5S4ZVH1_9FIRM|nr:S1 RNA-binding domain-containing protein [Desulfallas thermosapovorans]TYO96953.1 S1 RNA binding domain protein [Desulfallas thermosapovorans DSM 6562]